MPRSHTIATAQIVTGIAAAIALLHFLASIIIPFVIAFVLAVLVNALVGFIQNRWAGGGGWGGWVVVRPPDFSSWRRGPRK
jgi:predicted PurR-regulated permease PerM